MLIPFIYLRINSFQKQPKSYLNLVNIILGIEIFYLMNCFHSLIKFSKFFSL